MRFHIRVTPVPDEPLILTRRQALDGLGWLNGHLADFVLIDAKPFPQTGGYMIADVASREALDDLLATYPLRHTVMLDINEVLPTLEDGFDVLLDAIDKRERISAAPRLSDAEFAALDDIAAAVQRSKGSRA